MVRNAKALKKNTKEFDGILEPDRLRMVGLIKRLRSASLKPNPHRLGGC
jgi:hypothetical protein